MLETPEIDAIQKAISEEHRQTLNRWTLLGLISGALLALGGITLALVGYPDGIYPGTIGIAVVIFSGLTIPGPRVYESDAFKATPLRPATVGMLTACLQASTLRTISRMKDDDEECLVRVRHLMEILERHQAEKRESHIAQLAKQQHKALINLVK